MSIKSQKKIEEIFASKEERIQKILNARVPLADSLYSNHLRRQHNSSVFLDELSEVKLIFKSDYKILLLNYREFANQVALADVANIEFDGLFCKLAFIENYNCKPIWALYIAPDRVI